MSREELREQAITAVAEAIENAVRVALVGEFAASDATARRGAQVARAAAVAVLALLGDEPNGGDVDALMRAKEDGVRFGLALADLHADNLLNAIQRCPGCGITVRVLYEGHTCDGPQPFDPAEPNGGGRETPSAENGYGGYCMCDGTIVCGDHERMTPQPFAPASIRQAALQEARGLIEADGRSAVGWLKDHASDDADRCRVVGAEDAYRDALAVLDRLIAEPGPQDKSLRNEV